MSKLYQVLVTLDKAYKDISDEGGTVLLHAARGSGKDISHMVRPPENELPAPLRIRLLRQDFGNGEQGNVMYGDHFLSLIYENPLTQDQRNILKQMISNYFGNESSHASFTKQIGSVKGDKAGP